MKRKELESSTGSGFIVFSWSIPITVMCRDHLTNVYKYSDTCNKKHYTMNQSESRRGSFKNVDVAHLTSDVAQASAFVKTHTHSEMTNFITLPIPLSMHSDLKPNYYTRAKLKASPLNGYNPSADK